MANNDIKKYGFKYVDESTEDKTSGDDLSKFGFKYAPSEQMEPQQKPESFLEKAQSFLGGAAHSLLSELKPEQEFAQQAFQQDPLAFMGKRPPQITGIPLGDPTSPYYRGGELTAEYGPLVLQAGRLAPELTRLGIKAAGKGIAKFTGGNAKETGRNFIQSLLKKRDISKAHVHINDAIRERFKIYKKFDKGNYDNFLDEARDAGYTDRATKTIPGLAPPGSAGKVIETDLSQPFLDELKPTGKTLKDLHLKFKENPSLINAHKLQSELGSEGSRLSLSTNPSERILGGNLINTRNALNNDIRNTFIKNNDHHLVDMHKSATDYHRDYVAPFKEHKTLRDVVTKKGFKERNPANIHNVLKEEHAATRRVRELLPEDTHDLILAKALQGKFKISPKKGIQVKPEKLIDSIEKLRDKGFDEFIKPQHDAALDLMESQLGKSQKLRRYGAYGLGATGVSGILRRLL